MAATQPVLYNVTEWIEENKHFFPPPVCNKMMHQDGQLKVFFVGGPNQRKDYHIECGEELFYMLKGDMVLKIVENNNHRDVAIKEGEIFLLPGRIAHSPQRWANTMGLVIERERHLSEKDGLRYFVEADGFPTLQTLYEEWFYCTDLGTQLGPVIKRFFASEQCRTGKPLPGTITDNPPVILDAERCLESPFKLASWISRNKSEIADRGYKKVFEGNYQFQVYIYGKGETTDKCDAAETWVWQLEGTSTLECKDKVYNLKTQDSVLVPQGTQYSFKRNEDSIALLCWQDVGMLK